MKVLDIPEVATVARTVNSIRAAMTVVHDSADTRLVVFRLEPGQAVPVHRNASTVTLTVIEGRGLATGGLVDQPIATGDVIVFEPNELHGMRAPEERLVLLATITPRPGYRVNAGAA